MFTGKFVSHQLARIPVSVRLVEILSHERVSRWGAIELWHEAKLIPEP